MGPSILLTALCSRACRKMRGGAESNLCLLALSRDQSVASSLGFQEVGREEVPRPLQAELLWGGVVAGIAGEECCVMAVRQQEGR